MASASSFETLLSGTCECLSGSVLDAIECHLDVPTYLEASSSLQECIQGLYESPTPCKFLASCCVLSVEDRNRAIQRCYEIQRMGSEWVPASYETTTIEVLKEVLSRLVPEAVCLSDGVLKWILETARGLLILRIFNRFHIKIIQ